MPGRSRSFYVKCREGVLMTRRDAASFSAALRKVFPQMRFVAEEYWKKFENFDAWRQANESLERELGMSVTLPRFFRDPGSEPLDYLASLGSKEESRFLAWVEPKGWRPRWQSRLKNNGGLFLANAPRHQFQFFRSLFHCRDRGRFERLDVAGPTINLPDPPSPLDNEEVILLGGDRMLGGWDKGDDKARAFVAKVWRIASKLTTNRLVAVDQRTRQPYRSIAPGPIDPDNPADEAVRLEAKPEMHVWAGPDALEWARQRRHNYFDFQGHWYKPAGYFG